MRILQIGSDRRQSGNLNPHGTSIARQIAYGKRFGHLDLISFSLKRDGWSEFHPSAEVSVYPTNSASKIFYGIDTLRILRALPRPEVVSVQDPFETGLLGLLIARLYRIPLHVQLHTDFLAPGYAGHTILNRLRVLMAGIVLRRARRIRVVSERIKEHIASRYGLEVAITVLPIFVDATAIKSVQTKPELAARFSEFKTKLLIVSRLEPEKNISLAISSFAKSAPEEACLIIVGEGSERAQLIELAREAGVSSRIFFEGERPAIDYYPLADLVLLTSKYEGYGLVIIEALAAQKPVLSTDVGIAREAGALIASARDFASALRAWFQNGPRAMHLEGYPYRTFDEYADRYAHDIAACI